MTLLTGLGFLAIGWRLCDGQTVEVDRVDLKALTEHGFVGSLCYGKILVKIMWTALVLGGCHGGRE